MDPGGTAGQAISRFRAPGRPTGHSRRSWIGIPEKTPKGKGIGLHTMDYRCRLIGASVQVQRRARRGTGDPKAFPFYMRVRLIKRLNVDRIWYPQVDFD